MTFDPILIVGTGALATLFAARLAASGHPVTMLGSWQAGLDALAHEGARLVDMQGGLQVSAVRIARNPRAVKGIKHALVLVKSWQTAQAATQLVACLPQDGLVVTLQNGLGNDAILSKALGRRRVSLGVTTSGATLLGPGLVRPGGEGRISLQAHPRLGALELALNDAGFRTEVVEDARSLVWGKLVVNAAINPLTALLRVPNGELLNRPSARLVMKSLASEAAAVAYAQGIRLPFEDPVDAAESVARRTATNHSSMFQDVQRGAPTEIDAICGAVTRTGKKAGIPTPVNQVCWQLVQAISPLV
jgi:2-dehydropantoate 2-reductase